MKTYEFGDKNKPVILLGMLHKGRLPNWMNRWVENCCGILE